MNEFLKEIDVFDKTKDNDFTVDTRSGILMSNMISLISSFLIFAQLILAVSPSIHRDLLMSSAPSGRTELVNISLNIVVNMPCELLHLDTVDTIGYSELNVNNTIKFRKFSDTNGFIGLYEAPEKEKCFPCYELLSNNSCCNGCEALKAMYKMSNKTATPENWTQCQPKNKQSFSTIEKCHVKGKISVNRVQGTFHIAPGRNLPSESGHLHELNDDYPSLSLQHSIQKLRFGLEIPTASNPLTGWSLRVREAETPMVFRYHMMVTPVVFFADGEYIEKGFEYTVLISSYRASREYMVSPGIFFHYSFTPYTISITWISRSFRAFLISTGGLLAGFYAIFSFIYEHLNRKDAEKEVKATPKQEEQK